MTDKQKFDAAMKKILSVSPEELKKREAEWKAEREKAKQAKPSSSRVPASS